MLSVYTGDETGLVKHVTVEPLAFNEALKNQKCGIEVLESGPQSRAAGVTAMAWCGLSAAGLHSEFASAAKYGCISKGK